jgi:hypothetical protein
VSPEEVAGAEEAEGVEVVAGVLLGTAVVP